MTTAAAPRYFCDAAEHFIGTHEGASDERPGHRADDRARCSLAARVDRTARQRARAADDEANGPVGTAAIVAAVVTTPIADAVVGGVIGALCILGALAVLFFAITIAKMDG